MNITKPIKAKSTDRLLSVIPQSFKMVNDKTSNGYKFINLLFGAETDYAQEKLSETYSDLFISTFDLANDFQLYEVFLSGYPQSTYLNDSGNVETKIKITTEDEFYNGPPTRISYEDDNLTIPNLSSILGLEYFRTDLRGSGRFLISLDKNEEDSYISNESGTSYSTNINSLGSITTDWSGEFPGIKTQNYDNVGYDETLFPEDMDTFSGKYPLKRRIIDESGFFHYIDYYKPYLGWTRDQFGTVVPIVDYSGEYYFDSEGNKKYYRVAYNNPYGFNNYSSQYLTLEHIPISGTLKLYDMDILDISGNAVEINPTGTTLYRYKHPKMNINSGVFEPVYIGYDETVPYWYGLDKSEGEMATSWKTTSWDYQHEGSKFNSETRNYDEPSSGNLTNKIKINNPVSRYFVTYKWKEYNKGKYITSLDSNRQVRLDSDNPIYSIDNLTGNLIDVDFSFTTNTGYIDPVLGDQRSKILTFDGYDIRPNSEIYKIEANFPVQYSPLSDLDFLTIQTANQFIGFSDEFIPNVNTNRIYKLNCAFDGDVSAGSSTEEDKSGNSNTLYYSGSNELFLINYNDYFGKKIIYNSGVSLFYHSSPEFIAPYVHYAFGFTKSNPEDLILLDTQESAIDKYIKIKITNNGKIEMYSSGYKYTSSDVISFDSLKKELIVRYRTDDIATSTPVFDLYYKDKKSLGFTKMKTFTTVVDTDTVSGTYMYVYKNSNVDIDYFKIYYEAY